MAGRPGTVRLFDPPLHEFLPRSDENLEETARSLGIAPLFLMCVYVSWYVILSGARLAYAVEHADFHDEFSDLLEHPRSNELIASRIAEQVARRPADTIEIRKVPTGKGI